AVKLAERQGALFGLPAIALVLTFGQFHCLGLHIEIGPGVIELPVSLDCQGDDFDDALAQRLSAELPVLARHLKAMAVLIEAQAAPQGLRKVERERRGKLRVERVERAVARLARAAKGERVGSAERIVTAQLRGEVEVVAAQLAGGRA